MIVCWFDWFWTSTDTRINIQYPTHVSGKVQPPAARKSVGSPEIVDFHWFNIRRRHFTIHLSILMHDWMCHIKLLYTLIFLMLKWGPSIQIGARTASPSLYFCSVAYEVREYLMFYGPGLSQKGSGGVRGAFQSNRLGSPKLPNKTNIHPSQTALT